MSSVIRKSCKDADGPSRFLSLPVYGVALVLGGMLAGCSDPGPAQEAGEAVDETVEDVDEDLRGWIEDLREDEVQEDESGRGGHDDAFSEEDPAHDMD
ncbi:hypothetical protein [Thioalkalivibrio sp. AKL7]|uniref:hypothetical protein n=1 Tax=Thioalkalivibrio sp. AKL7 TaxID=1158155 RepID=UPI0003800700|nr:hypothetical protein [Thioalkalivibrio sp. AKL7]